MQQVEAKVDRLEQALIDFKQAVAKEFAKVDAAIVELKQEMSDFKQEMRDIVKEMKEDARKFRLDTNRQWGELAHKMGTITEDLVHPSLPRIIREKFGLELESFSINFRRKRHDGNIKEYDAIGVSDDRVFLTSTKSTMRKVYIDNFVNEIIEFRSYFPEYKDKKIIGIMASLSLNKALLHYAEKQGFLMLAVGEEIMDIQNAPDFIPKEW